MTIKTYVSNKITHWGGLELCKKKLGSKIPYYIQENTLLDSET